MEDIVILGSGMASLGATTWLHKEGVRPVVYEKNAYYGGHTASFQNSAGFLFDVGPHISFTKDTRIQGIFAEHVDHEYETLDFRVNNYWQGMWLTHPLQLHLSELPPDLIVDIVSDFVSQQTKTDRDVRNYADWLITSYGKTFAELFPMRYTRKYHLTTAENMSIDWLGPRMYRPSLKELLRGAVAPWSPDVHYVSQFRYPKSGGFVSYLRTMPAMVDLRLNHELVQIDPVRQELRFSNGTRSTYGPLVSSIPLPKLIPMISGTPKEVMDAASRLACSTCVLVNLGVDRKDLSEVHLSYFYDEDVCFSRISFPHMFTVRNAPEGCGSVQAEVYFSGKYRPMTQSPQQLIDVVIADLRRVGSIRENDKILSREAATVEFANVIFDLERASALDVVHGYLDELGIVYCGRYGMWDYLWTDQAFASGERAAEAALAGVWEA